MYSVKIRSSIMIAHSLKGEVFGPAQNMHGATYIVDAVFYSENVDSNNIVIDIGLAHNLLNDTLAPLKYQNLDELDIFKDKVTTTEYLAKFIHDKLKQKVGNEFNGTLEIILGESHEAWASYKG